RAGCRKGSCSRKKLERDADSKKSHPAPTYEFRQNSKEAERMPKGYWIANVDVTHPEEYKAYVTANAEPLRKYGAKFLVRGGKSECMDGKFRSRMVVIEFPDFATALECYRSPEY